MSYSKTEARLDMMLLISGLSFMGVVIPFPLAPISVCATSIILILSIKENIRSTDENIRTRSAITALVALTSLIATISACILVGIGLYIGLTHLK